MNNGSATKPTINLATVGSLSAKFSTTYAAVGNSIQFSNGTANFAGAAIAGTTLTLGIGATHGSPATRLNIGDFVIRLQIKTRSALVHTEEVSFTVVLIQLRGQFNRAAGR